MLPASWTKFHLTVSYQFASAEKQGSSWNSITQIKMENSEKYAESDIRDSEYNSGSEATTKNRSKPWYDEWTSWAMYSA